LAIRYVNEAVIGTEDRNLLIRIVAVRTAGPVAPSLATPAERKSSGKGLTSYANP
jgi:hypothetical protein